MTYQWVDCGTFTSYKENNLSIFKISNVFVFLKTKTYKYILLCKNLKNLYSNEKVFLIIDLIYVCSHGFDM